MAKETALILAGAVAKGAFEAGALQVLSEHAAALNVSRVVGASSGALNASVFATGIRRGAEAEVGQRLVELWQDSANWQHALDLKFSDILGLKGLGSADRVLDLMAQAVAGLDAATQRPVSLQLVLATLRGYDGDIGGKPATTFERVVSYRDQQFDSAAERQTIFHTALASGAFPIAFAPVDVPGIGPCIDGGAVNNTPVKQAVDGTGVERIIVINAQPIRTSPPADLRGAELLSQIAEILVSERLYRDLHDAESINGYLAKLDALEAAGVPAATLAQVKAIFGWRHLEIVQIRPPQPLAGGSFGGFGDAGLRAQYIAAGREAAVGVLKQLI